jgi:hypothetical protein
MPRNVTQKLGLTLALAALAVPYGRASAQSVVTGTNPPPQVVTGTNPPPQVVTGTNPPPQVVTILLLSVIPSA